MFRSTLRVLGALCLALFVGLVAPVATQTTMTSTSLSVAVGANEDVIQVASATGFDAGDLVFVDHEAMEVRSVSGTLITVTRGVEGTAARAHGASAIVYVGAPASFYQTEVVPGSTCTSTAERFLPRIVLPTGRLYNCTGNLWQELGAAIGTVQASFVQGATAADALDTVFFLADRRYAVTAVSAVWSTAESTGSMDIMVEKLTGTTACGSGTDLLSAAIAGTGTANTVNNGSLTTTAASLLMDAGNRLCVDLTATPNEIVNLVVTATLAPR